MSLPEGMPKIMPTTAVMSPAAGIEIHKGRPSRSGQDGPGIGPYAEEGPVAQRDLACEPDEDIQAQGGNGRDPRHVDDIEQIGGADEWHYPEEEGEPDEGPHAAEIRLEDGELLAVVFLVVPARVELKPLHVYTLSISTRPKRP